MTNQRRTQTAQYTNNAFYLSQRRSIIEKESNFFNLETNKVIQQLCAEFELFLNERILNNEIDIENTKLDLEEAAAKEETFVKVLKAFQTFYKTVEKYEGEDIMIPAPVRKFRYNKEVLERDANARIESLNENTAKDKLQLKYFAGILAKAKEVLA